MTYRAWVCERCGYGQKFRENVWDCPGCNKEGCDNCFDRYAHCKACAVGKTDEQLRITANTAGWDFESDAPEMVYETGNQATKEHAVELGAKRKNTDSQTDPTITTESPS